MTQVLSHNLKSAATWGSGGASYDIVSQSIADAIDHVVNRVLAAVGGEDSGCCDGHGLDCASVVQLGRKGNWRRYW